MVGLCAPIPFKTALQNHARPAASKIKADSQVDAEPRPQFPVASRKQLMDLRLSPGRNIDALDLSVVLERRREGLPLPTHEHCRLEVPPMLRARTVHGALENGIEHDLPLVKLAVQDRTQFDPARVFLVSRIL